MNDDRKGLAGVGWRSVFGQVKSSDFVFDADSDTHDDLQDKEHHE